MSEKKEPSNADLWQKLDQMELKFCVEIKSLSETFTSFKQEVYENVNALKLEVMELKSENNFLKVKLDRLEGYSRRSNLVFYNVEEDGKETWEKSEEKVLSIINDKMKLSNVTDAMSIERAHRVGPVNKKPRLIVVKFAHYKIREAVLKQRKALHGSRYTVSEDFTELVKKQRSELKKHMEDARNQGHEEVFLRFDKLFVDGRVFRVDEDMKLRLISNKMTDGHRRSEAGKEISTEFDGKRKRDEAQSPVNKELMADKKKMRGVAESRKRSDSLPGRTSGERSSSPTIRDWLIAKN